MPDNSQYLNKIIDGKAIAATVLTNIKANIEKTSIKPGLAVIQVGSDPASTTYVKNKLLACEKVGIQSFSYNLAEDISEAKLINAINELNNNNKIHGILVQLPLPKQLNPRTICNSISQQKDVDGLSSNTLGKIMTSEHDRVLPCTPKGIMLILKQIQLNLVGVKCTIIGASNIVGKPLALELIAAGATVTICHKHTKNLQENIEAAELVITAIGEIDIIKTTWIQKNAVIIDIGINKIGNQITGDIDFKSAIAIAKKITPVPGGVGPITVAMLMQNTMDAFAKNAAK
jgi:methylenetetrahydrofolate dehydrogenase (NADP+) / methenyltetrahydrofolate cyclohydrolase